MAQSRTPAGSTDHALAKLYEALSSPARIFVVRVEACHWIKQVHNLEHRRFLESTWHEIEEAANSQIKLQEISKKLDRWIGQHFPIVRR